MAIEHESRSPTHTHLNIYKYITGTTSSHPRIICAIHKWNSWLYFLVPTSHPLYLISFDWDCLTNHHWIMVQETLIYGHTFFYSSPALWSRMNRTIKDYGHSSSREFAQYPIPATAVWFQEMYRSALTSTTGTTGRACGPGGVKTNMHILPTPNYPKGQ